MIEIKQEKPNIIFIFADQMRESAMGCSKEDVITPNLDKFASQGMRFNNAYSNTPVCTPARATIITGLHTLSHQLVHNDITLRTDVKTLAHCLNDEGYECGYIGKWHLDNNDRGVFVPPGPRRQGFDDYWASYNCNHKYFQSYYYLNEEPNPVWGEGYEPIIQTKLANQYIKKKVKEEKNFCLFLSWGPPHCPYKDVPQKYLDMYPSKDIKLRPNTPKHADKSIIAGYYAHITALDECFGQVMKTIEECNIGENTIIVFTSDHGDMLFSQNRGWKGKPWRESINIPFIIRWDKHILKNVVSDELISLIDVMPTLLSLANIQIPEQVEGVDVSKTMTENEKNIQEAVFINYPVCPERFSFEAWRGVVTKKFIYARTKEAPWLLYDNKSDYYQLSNLVNQEDKKHTLAEMEKILAKTMRRMEDEFESSEELCKKYYLGSIKGTFPFYENDIIKIGKEERINLTQK